MTLSKEGKSKHFKVHRLVATAFLNNPNNFKEVNHIDENRKNNRVDNLEWCNRQYNLTFGSRIEKHKQSVLKPVKQLSKDGNVIAEYDSQTEASKILNISTTSISRCCRGIRKSAGGFIFEYKQ